MFTRFFVDRPIFASVLSIVLVLAGSVAYVGLPVAQYPDITPPTVEVSTIYPGANAQTVADTVAAPIEQQVNGVEDMMYMSSQSTNDGGYALTVTFKPGTDLNLAQVLVQNRVNLVQPILPDLVKRRGVLVKKKSPAQLMIINLFSPDGSRDNLYLSNYATIQLRDQLARLKGIGDITYLGQRDYSMRLWLDPEKMAMRGLSATDVVTAIQEQNVQVAAGQVGQPPAPNGQAFQYTINTLGRLADKEQFGDMILKNDDEGRVIRMRDVSRIELGAMAYDQSCTLDGRPSVALSVYQLPGTNALETATDVRKELAKAKERFPSGIDYAVVYDTTPFIQESIHEVLRTLIEAVALVVGVMLLFLKSWRAAVIPLAAVPVSIIGSFAAMSLVGFSINNLTLFGLVLAIGIVVDDAIVVVEAVQHHIEEGKSPRDATLQALNEVSGPVIAVGLVLTAVFIPCIFISGIIGQFFRQFAVTIAVSTLISAFNSLTLSPALCALLLKRAEEANREPLPRFGIALLAMIGGYFLLTPHLNEWILRLPAGMQPKVPDSLNLPPKMEAMLNSGVVVALNAIVTGLLGWFLHRPVNLILEKLFSAFHIFFDWITGGYIRLVRIHLKLTPVVLLVYIGLLFLTYRTIHKVPSGFIPEQDKGYLIVNVQLPDAASLVRTEQLIRDAEDAIRKIPGVANTIAIGGQSALLNANAPNFGTIYVMFKPFTERVANGRNSAHIFEDVEAILAEKIPGANVNLFGAPAVEGLGTAGGFKLIIEDRGDTGPIALQNVAQRTVLATREASTLQDVFTGFRADTPWLRLQIDRIEAKSKGIAVSEIINTLQVYFGSLYVNDFNLFGRTWQVNIQAEGNYRERIADLKRLRARSDTGQMVPLGAFISIQEITGPVLVQRYNLYPSATINGTPRAGVSSSEAIQSMHDAAQDELSPQMKTEWTELALLQLNTADTAVRAFVLAVVLAFLVLAAQYESWGLPLAVIMVVPMCLLSAIVGVLIAGHDVNIFTQVGFIVLVGLACKNAILIVEFAKLRRDEGMERVAAVLSACQLRFRPIIMTSVAFIFGVIPLVLSTGAGSEMRRMLGTAVFAGMIGVTGFGIFLTPVFFSVIQYILDRAAKMRNGGVAVETIPSAGEKAIELTPAPEVNHAPVSHKHA